MGAIMRAAAILFAFVCLVAHPAFADSPQAKPVQGKVSNAKFIAYGQPVLAFTHAEIIDGTGTAPRYDQTLVVRRGRIAALGPFAGTAIPKGATIIDARGKTLLPGFVMVHEHLFYPLGGANYSGMLETFPPLYLAGGTTTARTAGTVSPYGDLEVKKAIAAGKMIGPDLDVTGPYIQGPGLPILKMHVLQGPDDAKRTVDYWAYEGATSFKGYMNLTRAELGAAIKAAHAHHMKMTAHLCSITYREAAALGIDDLEHGFAVMTDFVTGKQPDACPKDGNMKSLVDLNPNDPRLKALMQFLIDRHVAITSTLTVFETFTPGRPEAPLGARELLMPQLRHDYETAWAAGPKNPRFKPWAVVFPKLMQMERMYVAMGGTLLAGTDPTGYGGVLPGYSGKREVQLLREAGFSMPQAIQIATLNGARYLGRDKDVGSLAAGKRADIALVAGDPDKDARALDSMPYVFKAGVGYNTKAIFAAMKGEVGLR